MIAPITAVSPSAMQSTSTSVASSRKRSTRTGRSGEAATAWAHVVAQLVVAVDDLHGAAAEDEAGADQDRVADLGGGGDSLVLVRGGAVGRLVEAELVQHLLEELAVLGALDRGDGSADDLRLGPFERLFQAGGEVERGLAAELDDDAVGLHAPADVEDVLQGERLEEELSEVS